MHKLDEAVNKSIDAIVERGITLNNVKALGELVDMKKDIENIKYWHNKFSKVDSDAKPIWETVSDCVGVIMNLNERYKNSNNKDDMEKMNSKIKELLEASELIKSSIKSLDLPAELEDKFKKIYK